MLRPFGCLLLVGAAASFAACSSSSSPSGTGTNTDGGTSGDKDAGGTATVRDRGVLVDFSSQKPVSGLTFNEAGKTSTTGADGVFTLEVPVNTPLVPMVTGSTYTKTYLPELMLTGNYERAPTPIPDLSLFHLAQLAFDAYDTSRGIVYLVVTPVGACTTIEGAVVNLTAPSDAKVGYFENKFPTQGRTAMKEGEFPAAAVYNVPAGSQIDVTITHPTCKMGAFPYTFEGRIYTGHVTVEAGDSNSVANYYLE